MFGHDVRVPRMWLDRFGRLVRAVTFFFLHSDGNLETLHASSEPALPRG